MAGFPANSRNLACVLPFCTIQSASFTGRSSAWSEHLLWEQEVAGSNPVAPIDSGFRFPGGISPATLEVGHEQPQREPLIPVRPDAGSFRSLVALDRSEGRYLVELPDLHGAFDILVSLRGPENLCLDLIDCRDLVVRAAAHAADGFVAALERAWAPLREAGQGATTWIPFYHRELAYVPSCDFWCLVSEADARDIALPTIRREMEPMRRSIFHLDGPQALRHLDLLLALPDLHAVQWVYGAGNGPAAQWIEVYRRIRAAGKGAQVVCEDGDDALAVLQAVGPEGLFFSIERPFPDSAFAEAFLETFAKAARSA